MPGSILTHDSRKFIVGNNRLINIEQILDAIDTWEASNNEVTVLLSTIIGRSTRPFCDPNPVYNNVNVSNLNGLISNLVSSRTNDRLRDRSEFGFYPYN